MLFIFFKNSERYEKTGRSTFCLPGRIWNGLGRKKYDLEVQKQDKGADPYRARYHSSVMDIENLHSGQEFKELPDTYTIFIIEKDFYGQGEATYTIERITLRRVNLFISGLSLDEVKKLKAERTV